MLFKNRNPEDQYLEQAIRGERAGLEYLVNTYRDMAYSIAIRVTGNHEDAEEVVQDGFLKAFKNLAEFKRASKFSTWLYRIIYNTALSKASSGKNFTMELQEDNQYQQYIEPNAVMQQMAGADRRKYLNMAMQKLKAQDQLILSLHYIAEKSITEITEILGMKSSAIKMRLFRSRKQLLEELQRLLPNEFKDL
ncbi:sigma-70 family RNA polymerase sigma factor [Pedobacter sp. JY14-1]|uniref:RNA polymerase sigma factor n=1 Tax=Pedobacter sp. JY14-1 TaxID=3034151 RepID=UPI0023E217FB|nr:sigma-70 family RNA polymerase sigma factor [Pedobacter sp. JY14-1]